MNSTTITFQEESALKRLWELRMDFYKKQRAPIY